MKGRDNDREGYVNLGPSENNLVEGADTDSGVVHEGEFEQFIHALPKEYAELPPGDYEFASHTIEGEQRYALKLNEKLIYLGHLTFAEAARSDSVLIQTLMHPDNAKRYFGPGTHRFELEDASGVAQTYSFMTDCGLSVLVNKYGEMSCRVYQLDEKNEIGKGAFATVYQVEGGHKVKFEREPVADYHPDEDDRVVKIIQNPGVGKEDFKRSVKRAYRNAKQTKHLRPRKPTFQEARADGVQVATYEQRKMPGAPLSTYIYDDLVSMEQHEVPALSLDDRFQISIKLLRSLINQVQDVGLIHRDIKMENILLKRADKGPVVNLVDFDFATQIINGDHYASGMAAYADRHAFDKKWSVSTDLFAMCLVVGMIWRDTQQHRVINLHAPDKISTNRAEKEWKIEFELFQGLDDLPEEFKVIITDILTTCTQDDLAARLTAEECLTKFETLYHDFKKKTKRIPPELHEDADIAFKSALHARELLNSYHRERMSEATLVEIKKRLQDIMLGLPDHPVAIEIFVGTLDVEALLAIDSKQDLIARVEVTLDQFHLQLAELQKQYQEICEIKENLHRAQHPNYSNVEKYRLKLHKFLKNMLKTPVNLDTLAEEEDHMRVMMAKVLASKKHFSEWVDKDAVDNTADKFSPRLK